LIPLFVANRITNRTKIRPLQWLLCNHGFPVDGYGAGKPMPAFCLISDLSDGNLK